MQQLLLNLLPEPTPSLSQFMPGDNAELLEALQRWLESPQTYPGNLFVVWGAEGVGKSFLTRCLGEKHFVALPLDEQSPAAPQTGWLLDDAQALDAAGQQNLFRHLIRLAQTNERLFITLDASPDMQCSLREDVRTRLGAGHIYRLTPMNEAQQRLMLAQRAQKSGWQLTEDELDTINARRAICQAWHDWLNA